MSQSSGQADNHKAVNDLIPSNQWGDVDLIDLGKVEKNLLDVKAKLAHCKVKIIGVTKYYGLDTMLNGYKAGIRAFGESRALDAIKKIEQLPKDVRENSEFHFIGHLQTNKAEKVVEYFDYIQSVDSLRLAEVISQVACRLNKREKVLLQVNLSGEVQKFGYDKASLREDFSKILNLEGLELVGLMCMAPFGAEESELRTLFRALREFRDELEQEFKVKLSELSMGMSDDYEIAVAEGATMIRIGRKLFS